MLGSGEINIARQILGVSQPFNIYFNSAIEDLSQGLDNRWFHFSRFGGMIMGIDFDGLRVFSIIGLVDEEILSVIATNPMRTEFHIPMDFSAILLSKAPCRLKRKARLKYYLLHRTKPFLNPSFNLRRLSQADLPIVEAFYQKYYDGTVFSAWMLDRPFWGALEENKLVATGGTIVIDQIGKAANIGNFLTTPEFRGKGLAKAVTMALIDDLIKCEITNFTLGTVEENISAWRAYEAVGFNCIDTRDEIEFSSLL